jgi:hypothetical protein
MELLLYRWSTGAQIVSALMIAVFFLALARSVRRVELRPWNQAWIANLVALLATVAFWFLQPNSPIAFMLLRFGYFFGKTLFSILWPSVRGHSCARESGRRTRKLAHRGGARLAAVAASSDSSI